ncbi:hypothetical protein ACFL2Q_12330 [Thermodesulfobacteriota bacterium]
MSVECCLNGEMGPLLGMMVRGRRPSFWDNQLIGRVSEAEDDEVSKDER